MEYNYQKIKQKAKELVKEACSRTVVRDRIWEFHILPVLNFSQKLGKQLGADLEIIELAAILHDYSGILDKNLQDNHHIESAEMARDFLGENNYPKEKINHVVECIESHRGSMKTERNTLEAKILASADAMSHISEPVAMMHLAFRVHDQKVIEGASWLRGKIERSWNKIMPEGQELIRDDYEILVKMLDEALEKR